MHPAATAISEGRAPRRLILVALAAAALSGVGSAAARASEAKAGGAPKGPTFVQLPPIVLPVFNGNKIERQAGLVLALQLEAGKSEDDVAPRERQLFDAFITELHALYDQHAGSPGVINAPLIKERLLATCGRVLGPGIVHEVLIQQAYERAER